MFDHVTIRVSDRAVSEHFYDTVLATLDVDLNQRYGTFSEWQDFSLTDADDWHPPTERLHVGFAAPSRGHVDRFWAAGTESGWPDDGQPGPRPQYRDDYYGAFLLDPDGNSAEAVHHAAVSHGATIDHLWIRTADLAAARRFYETIAQHAALRVREETDERVQFVGAGGSFSLVQGLPTKNVHLAFGTTDDGDVKRFHGAATDAGYQSNGPPGERARYHPGYYGAYVLDPQGNNVEVVNHHRL
jgi:catechol 2,3-dioxygenase-like lactoylglutathione lyase family enzyme